MLLGKGDGTFEPAAAGSGVGLTDTPFLADFNGDGIPDSVVLDRSGNILFRAGLPGAADAFAPPVILNPGRPARAITILQIGSQFAIAAADAHFDPTLSTSQFVFTVSIYTISARRRGDSRRIAFSTTALPTSLTAADLTGNGLDDLIAANALDNSVTIALQTSTGAVRGSDHGAHRHRAVGHRRGRRQRRRPARHHRERPGLGRRDRPAQRSRRTRSASRCDFRASTGFYGLSTTSGSPAVSSFAEIGQPGRGRLHRRRPRRCRGRQSRRRTASPSWPPTAPAASPTRSSP